ncbi:MAG: HPr family phosphocarrier protein [Bacteroidota bacterium]|nr:HPr family phosphocarrier protein [Candidatus Kapabacteria bacterium]MDW8219370.1 HPr family phosphocarrier protein [Bacteroidota bacterium]
MITHIVTIKNRAGLHTRPAAMLVKITSRFQSDIFLVRNGFRVNAKSIIGVMTLAAEQNSELTIELDGSDEQEALQAVLEFFEGGFGEA